MAKPISATEAAKSFSRLLNEVRLRGKRFSIRRGGKAVASLGPAGSASTVTLADAVKLLNRLPSLGDDAADFAADVRRAIRRAPRLPRRSRWA
jgi:antitoxin (DNA-binding transcriptional repressor) of toxin-antitoxin stability system